MRHPVLFTLEQVKQLHKLVEAQPDLLSNPKLADTLDDLSEAMYRLAREEGQAECPFCDTVHNTQEVPCP